MSNIRPISLQPCLGKMLNRLLAMRLSSILAQHPILHPAQRGFVLGGKTAKCIGEVLDAWGWSRDRHRRELHAILDDIKQAYDSVQAPVLVRALQRLRMPPSFVQLVAGSCTGLSSCVRTVYGLHRAAQPASGRSPRSAAARAAHGRAARRSGAEPVLGSAPWLCAAVAWRPVGRAGLSAMALRTIPW